MTSALWAPQGGLVWVPLGALPRRKAPGTGDQGIMAGLALVPTGTYMFMPTLPAMQAHTQIHLSAEPGIRLQQGSHVVAKHNFACFVNVAACSHLLHSCLCGSHGPNLQHSAQKHLCFKHRLGLPLFSDSVLHMPKHQVASAHHLNFSLTHNILWWQEAVSRQS